MRPVLFNIPLPWAGALPVRAYGFMVMLGCLAGVFLALRRAKRERVDSNIIWDIWMWSLIGGFAGARTFYVILFWPEFKDNLFSVFYIWQGGLAFQGGLVGAIVCVYVYLRMKRLSFARYVDMVVAGLILGYAFARVGCFLNGCCFGEVTAEPWGVTYPARAPIDAAGDLRLSPAYAAQTEGYPLALPDWANSLPSCKGRVVNGKLVDTWKDYETQLILGHPAQMPRSCPVQPTQLYSCFCALVICGLLLFYARLPHHIGQETALFGVLYAIYRFSVEFLRGDSPHDLLGLTVFQVVCLCIFLVFGAAWLYCRSKMPKYSSPGEVTTDTSPAVPEPAQRAIGSSHGRKPVEPEALIILFLFFLFLHRDR